ncbi:endo alpha-1,4 polygalactosaminidase [Streptomyces sp. NPDC001288]|uniref:endo alpha-1,4 polygalactosaminidase n=1 Tax=Streptomyces sp. NPDC001297 TaxID=3364559 RepID=UPI00367FBD8B
MELSMSSLFSRKYVVSAVVVSSAIATMFTLPASAQAASFTLPPAGAGFDYQIGVPYDLPEGVAVVSRDWKQSPAAGAYNICYVNGFQTQKAGESGGPETWDRNLLLKDSTGNVAMDKEWAEAFLDITTPEKRDGVAAEIAKQIDTCASKGFQGLEIDNLDSYERSGGLIQKADAEAYARILSAYAHDKGLAVGQKNALGMASDHVANGFDFAVTEECGAPPLDGGALGEPECDMAVAAFGNLVFDVEYTDQGLGEACNVSGISVVRRDRAVLAPGGTGEVDGVTYNYERATCSA